MPPRARSSGYALLTDNDGKAITTNGGAPTNGYSMPSDEELRGDVELLVRACPASPHEVAIDATSAEDHDIALGSHDQGALPGPDPGVHRRGHRRLRRRDQGPRRHHVGVLRPATAQQVLGTPDEFDRSTSAPSPASARPSWPTGCQR